MSGYLTSIIDLSKILSSLRYTEKPDSQVLDPFSCLIRLCLLNYKPIGTKLSFTNNKIVFQEPDFLQPAKRWSSGDSRQHIHNLYNPIFKLNQWYDINTPQFVYLLNKSKSGLLQLLKCYNANDSNIISHSINYYIETINNILKKKSTPQFLNENDTNVDNIDNIDNDELKIEAKKNKNKNKNKSIQNEIIKDTDKSIQNEIIKNTDNDTISELSESTDIYSIKLKDLWNLDEINIVYLILQEIEKKTNSSKFNNSQSLILSIEQMLIGKDEILNNIVNKISTSL
jgi:hypothetical protein